VNGKISKKVRKIARRDFGEYAEAINKSPFRLRLKIALRVLRGKL
jgi:hypothetical protein